MRAGIIKRVAQQMRTAAIARYTRTGEGQWICVLSEKELLFFSRVAVLMIAKESRYDD